MRFKLKNSLAKSLYLMSTHIIIYLGTQFCNVLHLYIGKCTWQLMKCYHARLVFHVHCLVFHVHCLVLLTVNYYTCRTDIALIAKTVISTRKLRSQCLTLQELHCLFFHYLIHRNFGTTFFCFFKLPHTL